MSDHLQDVFNNLNNANVQAPNLWSGYQMPYSGSNMIDMLNRYTSQGSQNLKRQGATNVASATGGAAKRAMSAGYGGSVGQDLISGAGENATTGTTNALAGLESNRLAQLPGLMQTANQNQFNVTGQEQSTDFNNISNLLQKYGLMGQQAQQIDSQPGLLDDIMSGVGGIASLAAGISTGGASSVLSGILGGGSGSDNTSFNLPNMSNSTSYLPSGKFGLKGYK